MVGARLVDDSSIAASSAWSSESSTFFIRELGPRTRARPERRNRKHRAFICSPPRTSPKQNPRFPLQTRGWRHHVTSLTAWLAIGSQTSLLPTLLGRWKPGPGGGGMSGVNLQCCWGDSPRILNLKQHYSKSKSGMAGCSPGCKCDKWELVGLTWKASWRRSSLSGGAMR